MKRIMLFGLLAGVLAATSGCGLFQSIFCYRPCTMRGDCGGGAAAIVAMTACGPRCGARGRLRRPASPRLRRLRRRMLSGVRPAAAWGTLPELRHVRPVRRLLWRRVRGPVRRWLLRPPVAPWSVELPVRPIYSRLLVRAGLRRALLGRFLLRPA